MAKIINTKPHEIAMPSGHIIPPAIGKWTLDGFQVSKPGRLVTTNAVIRDSDNWLRGQVLAGQLSLEYDAEPATVVYTPEAIGPEPQDERKSVVNDAPDYLPPKQDEAMSVVMNAANYLQPEQVFPDPEPVITEPEPVAEPQPVAT